MEELASLKAYTRDLETSLRINKEMLETLFETNQSKAGKQVKALARQLEELAGNLKKTQKEKEKLFKSLTTFENDREKARKLERRREDAWREKLSEQEAKTEGLEKQLSSYDKALAELEPVLVKLA
jgi:peptidoglycan hydrolase CwlO-like protein